MTQPINSFFPNTTPLASQGAASKRLEGTLAKLTAATAVKPAAPITPIGDGASLSEANVLKVVRETAPLRELGSRLIDLRRILAGAQGPGATNNAQNKIDASLASIRKVAESLRGAQRDDPLTPFLPAPNGIATNVLQGIEDIQINAPGIAPGESIDVDVVVAQSAQQGAIRLSFGSAILDLATPVDSFVVEIRGAQGAVELSFSSGTTIRDVAETVNILTERTGVEATVSGTGIRLASRGHNAEEFVSVRVIDDGGIVGGPSGAYEYLSDNNTVADPGTRIAFEALENRLLDYGQDLAAFVNGALAQNASDTAIHANLGDYKVSFDLELTGAQGGYGQAFTAFTILGQAASAVERVASSDAASLTKPDALAVLDDAIREVERAEREQLLVRAGGDIALGESDIPVIREAQAKLLDEARRLGLLVDHDPAKAFEALKS